MPVTPSSDCIDDGFGNRWAKCQLEDCDLQVVRPGKAQCSNCDVGALRAERQLLREPLHNLAQAVRTARRLGQSEVVLKLSSELVCSLEKLKDCGLLPGVPIDDNLEVSDDCEPEA